MDAHEAKGTVKELEGKAEQVYGKAREKVSDAAQEWKKRGRDLSDDEESEFIGWVREYPGTAIGGALLIGFLTGSLVGSRR